MSATMQKGMMMRTGMRRSLAAAMGLYMAAFALPALAQDSKEEAPKADAASTAAAPEAVTVATKTLSVHDDWTVRCSGEGDEKQCEAVQTLQTPDMKTILAHIAVHKKKEGPVYLIVQVPPRVWLPANVLLKVDNLPDVVLTYKHCGVACTASVELTDAQLSALQASSGNGELVVEAGDRKALLLPISFKGLPAAMQAAMKD